MISSWQIQPNRTSLSLRRSEKKNIEFKIKSFKETFVCAKDTKYKDLAKEFVPENTGKITNWAVKNFNDWSQTGTAIFQTVRVLSVQTNSPYDSKSLCYLLSRFITETHQKDGRKYPASTLYQLLCGIRDQLIQEHRT